MQATIAAATGGHWLDAKATKPVEVLFLAAEEEQDELDRRAQIVAKAMSLMDNPQLLKLAETNLRLFGRIGKNERLMDDKKEPRDVFKKLKAFLKKNPTIKLVILDPAADYMSCEVEKDSAEAKDWVKLITELTMLEGRPTVLVAHHTRKDSKTGNQIYRACEKEQIPSVNADDIRGSGSLVQGFRWALVLSRREYDDRSEKVFLRVVKSNYTKSCGILQFDLDKNHGGILRFNKLITDADIAQEETKLSPIKKKILDSSSYFSGSNNFDIMSDVDDMMKEVY